MKHDDEILRLHPEIAGASLDIVKKNATILSGEASVDTIEKIKQDIHIKENEAKQKAASAPEDQRKVLEQVGAMYQISARSIDYLSQYLGSPEAKKRRAAATELRYIPPRATGPSVRAPEVTPPVVAPSAPPPAPTPAPSNTTPTAPGSNAPSSPSSQ